MAGKLHRSGFFMRRSELVSSADFDFSASIAVSVFFTTHTIASEAFRRPNHVEYHLFCSLIVVADSARRSAIANASSIVFCSFLIAFMSRIGQSHRWLFFLQSFDLSFEQLNAIVSTSPATNFALRPLAFLAKIHVLPAIDAGLIASAFVSVVAFACRASCHR